MKFKVYRDGTQWRWRLRAANGEIIAHGESYKNKTDCLAVVELVKKSSTAAVEVED